MTLSMRIPIMHILGGLGKSHISSVAVGICIGILIALILNTQKQTRNRMFIPNSPDSHDENDFQKGPDHSLNWNDQNSNSHTNENSTVAKLLYNNVRVLCWVMTNPNNIETKAIHVKATWGQRCNVLLFMSSRYNAELPAIALNIEEGRDRLWGKTTAAFKYIYNHHLNDADWFMKADDDTYIVLENLRYFLHDKSPLQPVYYGRKFKAVVQTGYMSGGAGYVLSKEAITRVVRQGFGDSDKCRSDQGGSEDVEMGICLHNVGVEAGDSRDELGRERFHPFKPEHHLIPDILPKDMWYWSYNYYPAKQGQDCCSDYSITFHYVDPNMMYVLEYLIYHLKPFGINTMSTQDTSAVKVNLSVGSSNLRPNEQTEKPQDSKEINALSDSLKTFKTSRPQTKGSYKNQSFEPLSETKIGGSFPDDKDNMISSYDGQDSLDKAKYS